MPARHPHSGRLDGRSNDRIVLAWVNTMIVPTESLIDMIVVSAAGEIKSGSVGPIAAAADLRRAQCLI